MPSLERSNEERDRRGAILASLLANRRWAAIADYSAVPVVYDVAKASSKKGELALLFLFVFPSLPALELDVYHCAAVAAV